MLVVALLAGCGISSRLKALPVVLSEVHSCLKAHGIAHPNEASAPNAQELAVPDLIGLGGLRVPDGVTRAQFEVALKECGVGYLRVGPQPITSPLLREKVFRLVSCLDRNGFDVRPPNFSGKGPVLDTGAIDVASARWVATAKGCDADSQLTEAELQACMEARGLEGEAKNNTIFELRVLELPRCLKSRYREEGQLERRTFPMA